MLIGYLEQEAAYSGQWFQGWCRTCGRMGLDGEQDWGREREEERKKLFRFPALPSVIMDTSGD